MEYTKIIGATKTKYLDDAAGALSVTLTPENVVYLEEPYVPCRTLLWVRLRANPPQGVVLLDEKK